uniref:DUF4211 domain-containing protein n=1 Tax=Lepisosteus oculatus TaxID=7918 RepID=W5MBN4_LEPOC
MDAASPKEHHLSPRPDLNCEHEKGQIRDLSVLPIKRKRTESSDQETDVLAFKSPFTIPNVEKDKKKQAVQFGVKRKLDVNERKIGTRSPESGDTTGDGERVEREVPNCDVEGGDPVSQGDPTAGAVCNSSAIGVSNNCGGNNRSQNKGYISILQDSGGGDGVSENRDHYFGISTNKDSCRQTLREDEMYHAKGKCTQTFFTAVSPSSGLDAECTGSSGENGNSRIDETEGRKDSYNSSSEDDFGNFGAYTAEEQREKIRRLFQREGLITVSDTGFDVHFDRVIKALITNAVNENFLESLYGKSMRKRTEEDMKQSLDQFDQKTIEPRLQALTSTRSWQRNYLNRLENYPCIDIGTCSAVKRKCQACCMDRMCKYSITLSGPPYDKKILKMEQFLKDNKRVVLVGSLCAEKTRLYHQLRHFKYNLYQECVSKVKKEDFDKNKPDEAVKQIFSKLHDCDWIEQQKCIINNLIEEADGFHQKAKDMIAGMKSEWGGFYG